MGGGFAFSRDDVLAMTWRERQDRVKWLAAQREAERKAMEKANQR